MPAPPASGIVAFQRLNGARGKEGLKVPDVIQNTSAEFGIARPFMLAAPDLKRIGLNAQIGGSFQRVEFLPFVHLTLPA